MNFAFLASCLLFCGVIYHAISRSRNIEENSIKEFWSKEQRANSVRKKSLDNLDYITIPDWLLSLELTNSSEQLKEQLNELKELSETPIVNLTGISNTDLKLTYGTANITILSQYDFQYTNMVRVLQKLAEELVALGEKELAIQVLEFSVSTRTDVSKTYYLLSSLYEEVHTPEKKEFLIQQAEHINSIMKDSIVRTLQASGQ